MKTILLLMTIVIGVYGAEIHPNIKTKYMIEKGYTAFEIYLNDSVALDSSEIRFQVTKKYGSDEDVIEVYIWDSYSDRTYNIDYLDKNTKILSVFFENITDSNLRELFLLTENNGKYEIFSYSVSYYMAHFSFDRNEGFDMYLNNIFGDYEGDLNASIVRKEVKGKLAIDYDRYYFDYDDDKYYTQGEKIAYINDSYDGLGEVDSLKEANTYITKYGDNVYGLFRKGESGFVLNELFEGYSSEELPYVVKHGRYREYGEQHSTSGWYKDGKKDGYWIYAERLANEEGNYVDGYREGKWVEESVRGRNVGLYKKGRRDGVWVEEYSGVESVFIDGEVQK